MKSTNPMQLALSLPVGRARLQDPGTWKPAIYHG